MDFESLKLEVESILERSGHALAVAQSERGRQRVNFPSGLAQAILEADPHPLKRWALTMAQWIVDGHSLSPREHLDDIARFMALKKNGKKSLAGVRREQRTQLWNLLCRVDFPTPSALQDASDFVSAYVDSTLPEVDLGGAPVVAACRLPDGSRVEAFRFDAERQIQTSFIRQTARWCVLGGSWGAYGGPPYYVLLKDGQSWFGILLPNYLKADYNQALRNSVNNGPLTSRELRMISPILRVVFTPSEIIQAFARYQSRIPPEQISELCSLFDTDILASYNQAVARLRSPGPANLGGLSEMALTFAALRAVSSGRLVDVYRGTRGTAWAEPCLAQLADHLLKCQDKSERSLFLAATLFCFVHRTKPSFRTSGSILRVLARAFAYLPPADWERKRFGTKVDMIALGALPLLAAADPMDIERIADRRRALGLDPVIHDELTCGRFRFGRMQRGRIELLAVSGQKLAWSFGATQSRPIRIILDGPLYETVLLLAYSRELLPATSVNPKYQGCATPRMIAGALEEVTGGPASGDERASE